MDRITLRRQPAAPRTALGWRVMAGVLVLLLALLGAACGSSGTSTPSQLYVSLGDSYAAGYQPTGPATGHTTTNGFAYQIPALAAKRGYQFKLVNFGCGGATTHSMLASPGCPAIALGPGGRAYPNQTQAAAAEQYLRSHAGKVGLVTVSIGGNDVTHCATASNPINCVTQAVATIKSDLNTMLPAIRQAAGPNVPIVGLTYPDVILGLDVSTNPAQRNLATLSVTAFRSLINPTLQNAYRAVGARFVDVTAATGAYTPLSQTTTLAPYGTVPVAVADVCDLTYFCQYQNIHPKTAGYAEIARLVVATLPVRH